MRKYDQWKTAAPEPEVHQIINEKLCDGTILIGYGKAGHGMNGKDADLDRCGQCLVKELITVDPIGAENLRIDIVLRLYATICAPSYDSLDYYQDKVTEEQKKDLAEIGIDINNDDQYLEYLREQATGIVCGIHPKTFGDDPFACMWDGDEAWTGGVDVTLSVDLTVDEYETLDCGEDAAVEMLDTIAARIYKEICDANKGGTPARDQVKLFEEEVGLANAMINNLP